MTSSNVAEQLFNDILPSPDSRDFTFAATWSVLRKMRLRMCEGYDVKVCGILCSVKRDVREIEILGRGLGWTEEGLECEANIARHWWSGWD